MTLDIVHDTQKTFRALVNASAFPGSTISIKKEADKIDIDIPLDKGVMLLCLTLLDAEVKFYCHNENQAKAISQMTYSHASEVPEADFLITSVNKDIPTLLSSARIGTLLDPHMGATILLPAKRVGPGNSYELKGPGIQDRTVVEIETEYDWLEARNEANKEFPLGIDLYFLDEACNLMVLPRTTQVGRIR